MAATALDVLSLEYAKQQLRLPNTDHEHDDLIRGQIGAAVSFVGRHLRAPLVDTTETHRCIRPGDDWPLAIRTGHVRSMSAIRYWSEDRELREAPDGSISVASLGRRVEVGRNFCIWPPAAGWPTVATDSLFEIDLVRSLELTSHTQALVDACVLAVRALYDGQPLIQPTASMYALMWPWRRLDADPPGSLVTVHDGSPAPTPGGDIPETPITPPTPTTPTTYYLLASVDSTFTAPEVIVHSTTETALAIPAGTIPTGEQRYIAYGRPASLGAYAHAYFYPAGHRNTLNVLGAFEQGPNLTISGVAIRLLRGRAAYHDNANTRILEAG